MKTDGINQSLITFTVSFGTEEDRENIISNKPLTKAINLLLIYIGTK